METVNPILFNLALLAFTALQIALVWVLVKGIDDE